MNSFKHLSQVFQTAEKIPFDDSSKLVMISDCHRGAGSQADEFFQNENLYLTALKHYYDEGYSYIEIGDGDELWENKKLSDIVNAHLNVFQMLRAFHEEGRLYFLYGNHDMVKRSPRYVKSNLYQYFNVRERQTMPLFDNVRIHEGLVLDYQAGDRQNRNKAILLIHGHQVDALNSTFWKLSRFLVRYFWKPLELFGIRNPTSPAENQVKKEKIARRLTDWVIQENQMLIAGHNHRPMFPEIGEPLYFNDGSCTHPLFITGIEICNGEIALVKWSVKVREDGLLYVGKDFIAGPKKLGDFFKAERIYESCSLKEPI